MSRIALAMSMLIGCGDDAVDPCADTTGTCVSLRVQSVAEEQIARIDQLELDIVYGERHSTTTTQAEAMALPAFVAIELPDLESAVELRLVAAGKLAGDVLGQGATLTAIAPEQHASITIELAAQADCVDGALYCGGTATFAGHADTLYRCNSGGVPITRGVCAGGCIAQAAADACRGVGGVCVNGGFYCGGDKVDGDPDTLYRCAGGLGVDPVECASGCVVAPPGTDDYCR